MTFSEDRTSRPESFPRGERYRYVRTLGQGGMGTVYEAFDVEHGHSVALKTVLGRTDASTDMLVNEFRTRRVNHPNLVRLLELSAQEDQIFFTMELLEATDLAHWVWVSDPVCFVTTMNFGHGDTAAPAHPVLSSSSRPRLSDERIRALAKLCCDLVSALHALHRAGLVHRDVKPNNILVTEAGRVVLADFGLATAFQPAPGEPRAHVPIAGTVGYMAPELLEGRPSPASDLFALGATIVHAITGAPPTAEGQSHGLQAVCADPRLVDLVARMLAQKELDRPDAHEVFGTLAAIADTPMPSLTVSGLQRSHPLSPHGGRSVFVGRHGELAALGRAFASALTRSSATVVNVRGPSGVGKTTLINEWLRRCEPHPDLLVLRGYCHPQERLAFGGFDNVIKNLRAFLLADPTRVFHHRIALPRIAAVFPPLRSLAPEDKSTPSGTAKERRHLAFGELRRLLETVAATQRLVIWLDDVQWLDADGRSLLSFLLREGGLARTLVVTSCRSDGDADQSPAVAPATEHALQIDLGSLGRAEVGQLVDAHSEGAPRPDDDQLFEATRGLPIFAEILALEGAGLGSTSGIEHGDPLSRVIEAAISRLDESARSLLSTIALSPQPMTPAVAIEAAATRSSAVVLRALEDAGLVRYSAEAERTNLTVFHDRIRTAHVATLKPADRRATHDRIALAYEGQQPSAFEALAYHHMHAEHDGRAAHYCERAAGEAEANLAFATAGDYYQQAIELRSDKAGTWSLWQKLGAARANEGRSEVAAGALEHAAKLLDAEALDQAKDAATCEGLLTRAAAEYLHCGRVQDGYRLLQQGLGRHGLALPRSHRACVAKSAWLRARFVAEGHRLSTPSGPVDDEMRRRLDILWAASTGLAHINHVMADVLLLTHMRTALRAGARGHAFRALTYAAAAEATIGGRFFNRRADELLAQGKAMLPIAQEGLQHYDNAWYWVSSGARAFFAADWPRVAECARQADEHWAQHGVGITWERSINNLYWMFALSLMGDVAGLQERHRIAFSDALRRDDPLAQNACRSGYSALLWLYRGELSRARQEAALALDGDRWTTEDTAALPWPAGGFRTPDYHNLLARVHIHLYVGDEGCDAYRRMAVVWPHLGKAMFLMLRFVGVDLRYLFGRAALAAREQLLERGPSADWPKAWTARSLEAKANKEVRRLARSSEACAHAYAHALRAGLPRTNPKARARELRLAAEGFDALHMRKHAAAARYWLGEGGCSSEVARMLVPGNLRRPGTK